MASSIIYLLHMNCLCECRCVCATAHVGTRGQVAGTRSLLLLCRFPGIRLGSSGLDCKGSYSLNCLGSSPPYICNSLPQLPLGASCLTQRWLTSEPQDRPATAHPRVRITGTHHHMVLFAGRHRDPNSGPHNCSADTLPTNPSCRPRKRAIFKHHICYCTIFYSAAFCSINTIFEIYINLHNSNVFVLTAI